jgi:hypothetical protein
MAYDHDLSPGPEQIFHIKNPLLINLLLTYMPSVRFINTDAKGTNAMRALYFILAGISAIFIILVGMTGCNRVDMFSMDKALSETRDQLTFSPAPGVFDPAIDVRITGASDAATVHYTTDGTIPDCNSQVYSNGVHFDAGGPFDLQAVACFDGEQINNVTLGTYTVTGATNTVYVDTNRGTDMAGCGPYDNPCQTIGFNIPAAPGLIRVAGGTYTESVTIGGDVSITGSFTSGDWSVNDWNNYRTIILPPAANNYPLEYTGGIAGTTITNLELQAGVNGTLDNYALTVSGGLLTIQNCHIIGPEQWIPTSAFALHINNSIVNVINARIDGGFILLPRRFEMKTAPT